MSGRLRHRAAAVALGLAGDALVGEPVSLHPVAGFGRAMTALERRIWADDRVHGTAYALAGMGLGALAGAGASRRAGTLGALAVSVWVAASGRMLLGEASAVADALDAGDLEAARRRLPALVGRATEGLTEKEVARAVVESVAENLSDAVVATALWGLFCGAPGVLAHRAANTMDAMVGHRSERYRRFGWAAARADDVLGWPAARATAALVALARPTRAAAVWRAVRRDAPSHPSPNAGVAEAAFAGALGLRLGGTNRYGSGVEVRPFMGDGRPPEPSDIRDAVALARRALAVLTVGLAVAAAAGAVAAGAVAAGAGAAPGAAPAAG